MVSLPELSCRYFASSWEYDADAAQFRLKVTFDLEAAAKTEGEISEKFIIAKNSLVLIINANKLWAFIDGYRKGLAIRLINCVHTSPFEFVNAFTIPVHKHTYTHNQRIFVVVFYLAG